MDKRRLKRDKVVSIVGGRQLVGVYFEDMDGSEVLIECSPKKADKLIKAWNEEGIDVYNLQISSK